MIFQVQAPIWNDLVNSKIHSIIYFSTGESISFNGLEV